MPVAVTLGSFIRQVTVLNDAPNQNAFRCWFGPSSLRIGTAGPCPLPMLESIPVKSLCNPRLDGCSWKRIRRGPLGCQHVDGPTLIERIEHPLSVVRHVGSRSALLESIPAGVSSQIQPQDFPVLPAVRRLAETIHLTLVPIRWTVG